MLLLSPKNLFCNYRSAARKIFIHRRIMEFYQYHSFFGAGMNNVIILQINTNVAELLSIEIKKNQVAFLQLFFVFPFDNRYLLACHPRQIDTKNLLFQQKSKARTIDTFFIQTAETIRRCHPLVDKSI